MGRDARLDDFVGDASGSGDAATDRRSESEDDCADASVAAEGTTTDPDAAPADLAAATDARQSAGRPTSCWRSEPEPCDRCGDATRRRWHVDGERRCAACVEW